MLLCCKVAYSTKNLQLKQFNGNFDTCICLDHLLPLYTSKMIMDQQDFACIESKYSMRKKRDNNLYEFVPFCF